MEKVRVLKIFNRRDPEVVANALQKSLPHFLEIYKEFTQTSIIEEAYHDIRVRSCEPIKTPISRAEFNRLKDINERLHRKQFPESIVDDSIQENITDCLELEAIVDKKEIKKGKITTSSILNVEKKPKKGEVIKECYSKRMNNVETYEYLQSISLPTSKEYIEEIFKKLKNEKQ